MIPIGRVHQGERQGRSIQSMVPGTLNGAMWSPRPHRRQRLSEYVTPPPPLIPMFDFDGANLVLDDGDFFTTYPDAGPHGFDLEAFWPTSGPPFQGARYIAASVIGGEPAVMVPWQSGFSGASPEPWPETTNRCWMSAVGSTPAFDAFTIFGVVAPEIHDYGSVEQGSRGDVVSLDGSDLGWVSLFLEPHWTDTAPVYPLEGQGGWGHNGWQVKAYVGGATLISGDDSTDDGNLIPEGPQVLVLERAASGRIRLYSNTTLIADSDLAGTSDYNAYGFLSSAPVDTNGFTSLDEIQIGSGTGNLTSAKATGYDWADDAKRAQVTSELIARFGIT